MILVIATTKNGKTRLHSIPLSKPNLQEINSSLGFGVVNAVAADYDVPHNIVVNEAGDRLFLSHSGGSSTKVVFYEISGSNLTKLSEADSGTNPFGVLYYKY